MQSLLHDYYLSKPIPSRAESIKDTTFIKITDYNFLYEEGTSIGKRLLQSLSSSEAKVVYHLYYDGREIHVYIGILPTVSSETSAVLQSQLHAAVQSEFMGVKTEDVLFSCIREKLQALKHTSALMGIPKALNTTLDRLIFSMGSKPFSYSVIAENISHSQFTKMKEELFDYKSLLSTEKSVQHQNSRIEMSNHTNSNNQNVLLNSKGNTSTSGTSEQTSTTITKEDAQKEYEYQLVSDVLAYLNHGSQIGLWHTNVFLSTQNKNDLRQLESTIKGILLGDDPDIPNMFSGMASFGHEFFHECVLHGMNPIRKNNSNNVTEFYKYDCAMVLSTNLLANSYLFSNRTLPGLRVFKRDPLEILSSSSGIHIGNYRNIINDTNYELRIPEKLMNRHVFVTGLTGSGKTNSVQNLLVGSKKNFLVIEPAKSEYRKLKSITNLDVQLYTVGDIEQPFSMNPFGFLPGMNLQKHIDILKSVINSAFGMYGPLPYIIEKALTNTYKEKGWNLITSKNEKGSSEEALFPTMLDFKNNVIQLIETTDYAPEQKMNIKSALVVRLESLCEGIKGTIFNTKEPLNIEELLQRNVIIELRHLGDEDDQSFVMGIILAQIYEYLEMNGQTDDELKHLIVIEEAHRLLPNINTEVKSAEFGTMRNKSVSFFNNMLSEIRAYGEGIIVVDQIPSKVSTDILKNTSVKIVHRLVSEEDKVQIASMINLKQSSVITELETGEALVYFEGLNTAAYAKIDNVKRHFPKIAKAEQKEQKNKRINIQLEQDQESYVHQVCNQLYFNLLFDYPAQVKTAVQKAKHLLTMKYPSADHFSILYKGISDVLDKKYYLENQFLLLSVFKQNIKLLLSESDIIRIKEIKSELHNQYEEINGERESYTVSKGSYYDEANYILAMQSGERINNLIENSFISNDIKGNINRLFDESKNLINDSFLVSPPSSIINEFTRVFVELLIEKLEPKTKEFFLQQMQ